ncbi:MAG: ABC transporter ATP-binding protein [Actinobacteria bacterium]|nr:MAG: ABC transporter ATP-binding protein [Actinomycetota bacterium]
MTALLAVDGLEVAYGKIRAVKGISFSVDAGAVVTLIGANGAGKTTTLRTLSGLLTPSAGTVSFEGRRIDGMPAHQIVELGIAHVPEGRRIFPRMTVRENLELGAFTRADTAAFLGGSRRRSRGDTPHPPGGELAADLDRVFTLFPVLAERRRQAGGTLSGGEQQMLAIGRAMMSRPRLLMLDEPSMGLSPIMMNLIFTTLAELKAQGTTILLVEQNAQAALALADRAYVIETGSVVLEGSAAELSASEQVRKAYLGED